MSSAYKLYGPNNLICITKFSSGKKREVTSPQLLSILTKFKLLKEN